MIDSERSTFCHESLALKSWFQLDADIRTLHAFLVMYSDESMSLVRPDCLSELVVVLCFKVYDTNALVPIFCRRALRINFIREINSSKRGYVFNTVFYLNIKSTFAIGWFTCDFGYPLLFTLFQGPPSLFAWAVCKVKLAQELTRNEINSDICRLNWDGLLVFREIDILHRPIVLCA